MRVIALKDKETYICQVSHKELEKLFNRPQRPLQVEDFLDLGLAYDFKNELANVLYNTREYIHDNKKHVEVMANAIDYLSSIFPREEGHHE
jgi:hypothetical protein